MGLAISAADIEQARARLAGVAHRTPVMRSRGIDALCGAEVFFKCENLQRAGAFKFRGAYNTLAQFDASQRAAGAVAFSSGNHAAAVALAARILGIPSVIVMPSDAPAIKLRATRGYQAGQPGSEVITYDRGTEDREAIARRLAHDRGMTLVPPFDHPAVMAGQGTAAAELIEEVGHLDTLVVCLGGGGLISGSAVAARARLPEVRIVGVEPEAGNDVQLSLAAGRIISIDVPDTIADGAQTQSCGRLTFAVIEALVEQVVTVGDDALVTTMRLLAERLKLVVEPTGALAAAAVLTGSLPVQTQRVGVILSGGNLDPARYGQLLAAGA